MNNKKYFRDAGSFMHERFSGVDGFNNFSDEMNFEGDYNAAGVNIHQQTATTSTPYEIEVVNANLVTTTCIIFGSYANRTAANFGNPVGITISSITQNVTYTQMLAQFEHKNWECGMIYIQAVSGSNSVITSTLSLTTGDAIGELNTKQMPVKKDPMQQQADVLEFYHTFKVNGFTTINIAIPASTTVHYSFYASATVDTGRTLGNVKPISGYKGPQIGKAQNLNLSPAALSALRG